MSPGGAGGSKRQNYIIQVVPCIRLVAPLGLGSESSIIAPRALLSLLSSHSLLRFPISSQSEGKFSLKVVTGSVVGWFGGMGVRSSGRYEDAVCCRPAQAGLAPPWAFHLAIWRRFQLC